MSHNFRRETKRPLLVHDARIAETFQKIGLLTRDATSLGETIRRKIRKQCKSEATKARDRRGFRIGNVQQNSINNTIRSQRRDTCVCVRACVVLCVPTEINPIPLLMIRYYCSHFRGVHPASVVQSASCLLAFNWLQMTVWLTLLLIRPSRSNDDRDVSKNRSSSGYTLLTFPLALGNYCVTVTFPFAFTNLTRDRDQSISAERKKHRGELMCHLFNHTI